MNIEKLPQHVANQIAAGEVVERPASVVKELIENSLDAGATQIEIDIYNAGRQLIRVKDNGYGIRSEQLCLAVERHATSKLKHINDLNTIRGFGFRGEALASIHSISRLSIFSKTAGHNQAFKICGMNRCEPCAHPKGTTVEVADLFFNTPARRRFLKSDKTEFAHIEDWVRRFAFVQREVTFILRHQGKSIRQYQSASSEEQYQNRLHHTYSKRFFDYIKIDVEKYGLHIKGYLFLDQKGCAMGGRYFYVNGRFVRDKLIQHAAKSIQQQLPEGRKLHYLLNLSILAEDVDVNVHPAKQEVRFHDARLVHDFIVQVFLTHLAAKKLVTLDSAYCQSSMSTSSEKCSTPNEHLSIRETPVGVKEGLVSYQQEQGCVPRKPEEYRQALQSHILTDSYFVDIVRQELWLVDIKALNKEQVTRHYCDAGVKKKPLLMPILLPMEPGWDEIISRSKQNLLDIGLVWRVQGASVCLLKMPAFLSKSDITQFFTELMALLKCESAWEQVLEWICHFRTGLINEQESLWFFWNQYKLDFITEPNLICRKIPWEKYISKNHEGKKV